GHEAALVDGIGDGKFETQHHAALVEQLARHRCFRPRQTAGHCWKMMEKRIPDALATRFQQFGGWKASGPGRAVSLSRRTAQACGRWVRCAQVWRLNIGFMRCLPRLAVTDAAS